MVCCSDATARRMRSRSSFRQFIVLFPTPTVAADVVPGGTNGGSGGRMAFQCQSAAKHGERDAAFGEQAHDAPEGDAAAVGEHALGSEVAAFHARVQHAVLGEPPFRGGIAVRHRRFRAFLVVQHEVQREPGAAGPFRVGWVGAVADQVPFHGGQIALIAARWPLVDCLVIRAEKPRMSATATSWILSEGYAGLQAQALGLAEAAGLEPEMRVLAPRAPWKWVTA